MGKINCKIFKSGITVKSAFILLMLSALITVSAQTVKIRIQINPNVECGTDDICHKIINFPKEETAFAEIKSDFFYAVVLKTTEKCVATESMRLKTQALFPKNKVFTSAVNCNEDDNAFYEGINENDYGFVAVYAGKTKTEAEKFLQIVLATNKFPGANLRQIRLILRGT